jgi:hypothetical protein
LAQHSLLSFCSKVCLKSASKSRSFLA